MKRDLAGSPYRAKDLRSLARAGEEIRAIEAIKQMNESYKEQVKALQRAAGIRISEELAGYKAGVELEEKEKPLQGIEKLDPIIAGLKSAQDSMNALIADKDFTGKHKQKLQALSQELNNIQGTLSNLASANLKKDKKKTLEP